MKDILNRGFIGVIAPSGGIAISTMAHLEAWLRITSLVVGIAVGVITFISILRSMNKPR